jgi:GntR family transcriptional regulator
VDLFSLDGTLAAFEKKGVALITAILHPMGMIPVSGAPENPFNDGEAYYFSRVSRADGRPVLIEDIYLHPVLFSGIDRFDLTGRSLSQAVEERFYLRPTGGRQLFRVDYPTRDQAKLLSVSVKTPILAVRRFLNFSGCENGVYAELFCRTDQYVFSQVIGG